MKTFTEKESDRVKALESRLIEFYQNTTNYDAFTSQSSHCDLWEQVAQIASNSNRDSKCRILEIGSGKSGLAHFLESHPNIDRGKIHLTCQDVTEKNFEHLSNSADTVLIQNINEIDGEWDIVTHSYVLEHLARPKEFLTKIFSMLPMNGHHVFQCPRYDLPIYLPPALDHCSMLEKLAFVITRPFKKQFSLIEDPAIFHLDFTRDRDAIHLVSKNAICKLHANDADIKSFPLPAGGWRDYIVKEFLTLRLVIRKTSNHSLFLN